ncbi:MAG TPA: hypothetical protein VK553_02980 [Candidatus Nitrosopolaris rasttigaisensis]|jgi:hypothetical protein|nr:hypothetical protein [Candidatus Nitrosopolaris rasttigaisensis]
MPNSHFGTDEADMTYHSSSEIGLDLQGTGASMTTSINYIGFV